MSKDRSARTRLSRRGFTKGLGLIGLAVTSLRGTLEFFAGPELIRARPDMLPEFPPAFEPIPSSSSGITWVHRNGRSPEMFLPETTGAGCAFLDYDKNISGDRPLRCTHVI